MMHTWQRPGQPAPPYGCSTITRREMLFPIVALELYLNAGLLIFFFGPVEFGLRHPVSLPLFLLTAHVLLYVGFRAGLRHPAKAYSGVVPVSVLIRLAILSVFVVALVDYLTFVPSLASIPGYVFEGMQDLSRAYLAKRTARTALTDVMRFTIGFMVLSPLMLPLVVAFWGELPRFVRLLAVLVKLWELGTWVGSGTTKGIADTFVLLPLMIWCAYPRQLAWIAGVRRHLVVAVTVLCASLVVLFFSMAKATSRFAVDDVVAYTSIRYGGLMGVPPRMGSGLVLLTSYMVQGYHGLDLCFSQPFVWAYGAGHSPFFLGQLLHTSEGLPLASLSYPARVEMVEPWTTETNWHSIYPWIASDLTFPGSLLFVWFLGLLSGLVWKDWLVCRNPLAFALLGQLALIFLYFPCNNFQVLGNIGVVGFVLLALAWRWTRVTHVPPRCPATVVRAAPPGPLP